MKTTIVITAIIALIGVGYLLALQFQPAPDNSAQIAEWKAEKQEYREVEQRLCSEIIRQKVINDSLKAIPPQIDKQIIYLQAEVDSSIAEDSLNAISEYRAGLNLLDIRTESTPELTLRELGIGAHVFRETYGLHLKIPYLYEVISGQDSLIGKQVMLIEIKDNVAILDSLTIHGLEQTIKDVKPRWWQSPLAIVIWTLIAFGLGLGLAL